MSALLCFEDLKIGDLWSSNARTITETDIVQFAGMTGDYNPLHVDHEYARASPFRQVVAHGLLGLSWVAGLGSNYPRVKTDAFLAIEKWEFALPAFVGDTVHVVTEVLMLAPSGRRRGKVTWSRKLINQKDEVLQHGQFVTLVAVRSPVQHRVDQPSTTTPRPHLRVSTN